MPDEPDTDTDETDTNNPLQSGQRLERYIYADVLLSVADSEYVPDDADAESLDADPAALYRAAALTILADADDAPDPTDVELAVQGLLTEYREKRKTALAERMGDDGDPVGTGGDA